MTKFELGSDIMIPISITFYTLYSKPVHDKNEYIKQNLVL